MAALKSDPRDGNVRLMASDASPVRCAACGKLLIERVEPFALVRVRLIPSRGAYTAVGMLIVCTRCHQVHEVELRRAA